MAAGLIWPSLEISYTLGSRGVARYDIIDTNRNTAIAYRPVIDTTITLSNDIGTAMFYGRIVGVDDRAAIDANTGTVTRVQLVDYTLAMDSRIVRGETYNDTLKNIVAAIQTDYLTTYGITVDAGMLSGPTLSVSFDNLTVTECLNRLSDLTGWVWRLTPGRVLEFFSVGTKTTSYSLTSSNSKIINGVQWSKHRKQYVNTLHVSYGPTAVLAQEQTFAAATAGQTSWVLDHTAVGINLRGYISVGGVFTPIGDGMTWQFNPGTNAITHATGAAGGEVVSVTYDAQFPDTVTATDAGEVASFGIWEDTVRAEDITDETEAQALAAALLLKYKAAPRTLTVRTRAGFVLPGNVITLTIPERTVTGSWLITGVTVRAGAGQKYDYYLTCVEGSAKQDSWQDYIAGLTKGGSRASGTFSGHMLPAPSGMFEGVVTSSHSPLLIAAHLGFVGTSMGAGAIGPGVDFNGGSSGGRWIWVANGNVAGGGPNRALSLLYVKTTGSADMPFAFWWDNAAGQFKFSPVTATSTTIPVVIGDKFQSFGTGRFDEINGKVLDASLGFLERGRAAKVGEWTSVAYSAGNFTASAGSWTVDSGDQAVYKWRIIGKSLRVAFTITGTDVSATPLYLRIAIPGGFTAAATMYETCVISDAGAVSAGLAGVTASGTVINIQKLTGNWSTASSDNTDVYGQIEFEVT